MAALHFSNYDNLEITQNIINDINYLIYDTDVNVHNRQETLRYAKRQKMRSITELIWKVSLYTNARRIWKRIITDIENGFQMPYVTEW